MSKLQKRQGIIVENMDIVDIDTKFVEFREAGYPGHKQFSVSAPKHRRHGLECKAQPHREILIQQNEYVNDNPFGRPKYDSFSVLIAMFLGQFFPSSTR